MKCLCSLAFCHSNSTPANASASGAPATILKPGRKCTQGRREHIETTVWCRGLRKEMRALETTALLQKNREISLRDCSLFAPGMLSRRTSAEAIALHG